MPKPLRLWPRARHSAVRRPAPARHYIYVSVVAMLDQAVSATFTARLDATAKDTETLLDRLLQPTPVAGEIARPQRLLESMRYSSLGGGKRVRPFLVAEAAALFDVPRAQALLA